MNFAGAKTEKLSNAQVQTVSREVAKEVNKNPKLWPTINLLDMDKSDGFFPESLQRDVALLPTRDVSLPPSWLDHEHALGLPDELRGPLWHAPIPPSSRPKPSIAFSLVICLVFLLHSRLLLSQPSVFLPVQAALGAQSPRGLEVESLPVTSFSSLVVALGFWVLKSTKRLGEYRSIWLIQFLPHSTGVATISKAIQSLELYEYMMQHPLRSSVQLPSYNFIGSSSDATPLPGLYVKLKLLHLLCQPKQLLPHSYCISPVAEVAQLLKLHKRFLQGYGLTFDLKVLTFRLFTQENHCILCLPIREVNEPRESALQSSVAVQHVVHTMQNLRHHACDRFHRARRTMEYKVTIFWKSRAFAIRNNHLVS
ncbi:hypothetical protein GQ600_11670 [Phytophthora cactorum]|nr:hypothetical protein GQ600_11670 [Phytophthora cactorum]